MRISDKISIVPDGYMACGAGEREVESFLVGCLRGSSAGY